MKTFIYIDGANLHQGIKSQDWELDYKRFYIWLNDKYRPEKIFIFLGFIKENQFLYDFLEKCGFLLIFKETLTLKNGTTKGNADTELAIQAMINFYENQMSRAILISGDGDFSCLLDFWEKKNVVGIVLPPYPKFCSYLIKKRQDITLIYLNQKNLIPKYKKTPIRD